MSAADFESLQREIDGPAAAFSERYHRAAAEFAELRAVEARLRRDERALQERVGSLRARLEGYARALTGAHARRARLARELAECDGHIARLEAAKADAAGEIHDATRAAAERRDEVLRQFSVEGAPGGGAPAATPGASSATVGDLLGADDVAAIGDGRPGDRTAAVGLSAGVGVGASDGAELIGGLDADEPRALDLLAGLETRDAGLATELGALGSGVSTLGGSGDDRFDGFSGLGTVASPPAAAPLRLTVAGSASTDCAPPPVSPSQSFADRQLQHLSASRADGRAVGARGRPAGLPLAGTGAAVGAPRGNSGRGGGGVGPARLGSMDHRQPGDPFAGLGLDALRHK